MTPSCSSASTESVETGHPRARSRLPLWPARRGAARAENRLRLAVAPLAVALLLAAAAACGDDEEADGGEGGGGDTGGPTGDPINPNLALSDYIDRAALTDRSTLDVDFDVATAGEVPGDFEEPVYQIALTFHSQTALGQDWQHDAVLIVPSTLIGDGSAAILPRSTPNPVADISDSVTFLPRFGAVTADRLDLPVLLLDPLPDVIDLGADPELSIYESEIPECFASPVSDLAGYEGCLRELAQASGRVDLYPALSLAVVQIRAVTLLQDLADRLPSITLPFELPDFQVSRVGVLADGAAGLSLRYAMALDERIAGVMVASADRPDPLALYQTQQEMWSGDFRLGEPEPELAFWQSPAGGDFLRVYGFSGIVGALADRSYLMTVGTNDPTTILDALSDYADWLPVDHSTLYMANREAGFGTLDQLLAWRVFLAHLFRDRPLAGLSTTYDESGGNVTVTATVSGETIISGADLFYVQRHQASDDLDYRDAVWRSTPMTLDGRTAVGSFPATAENTAFFVRLADAQNIYEGVSTSGVTLVASGE